MGKQIGQASVVTLRLLQQVEQRLILATRDHEQPLVEQGLLSSLAGRIQNEIRKGLVRHLGCATQHGLLLGGGPQT